MFEDDVGEKRKLVYKDGDQVRAYTGTIEKAGERFIRISKHDHEITVNKDHIIKVEKPNGGR